jgi:hypothetical protein
MELLRDVEGTRLQKNRENIINRDLIIDTLYKILLRSLCLPKHYAMKAYGGVGI